MVVVTRSARKRPSPSKSPIKNGNRRLIEPRTNSVVTRATAMSNTPLKRKCKRNLMDSLNEAADGEATKTKVQQIVDHEPMTPPPSPEPKEMICDSPKKFSPVKCNPIVEAKRLLSIGAVDGIIGRETEISNLSNFLQSCLDELESSTIFISGPPGTGKTLTVRSIINKLGQSYKLTDLFYNSMDFGRGETIYSKISSDLKLRNKAKYQDQLIAAIEKHITKAKNMVILTIDEIDKLHKDLVDALLDWPKARASKLILIGIANTITSKSLNKITYSFEQTSAKKISFRPYSKDQIVNIISSRLKYISVTCELISKPALELLARKVSSYTGDARKALDILTQAIEMAEKEKYATVSSFAGLKITADDGDNQGSPKKVARMSSASNSPRRSPRKRLDFLSSGKPLVEPRHIINILGSVFGNKLFSHDNCIELTMHQQVILCCIVGYGKERHNKELLIRELYKLFLRACNKIQVVTNQLSLSDFLCICQILESYGLVKIKQAKDMRLSKIGLSVNEDEVTQRISEKTLIQNLMNHINSLL